MLEFVLMLELGLFELVLMLDLVLRLLELGLFLC